MLARSLVLVAAVVELTPCASGPGDRHQSGVIPVTVPDRLVDGSWEFRVDRVWNPPDRRLPDSLQLAEEEFQRLSSGPTYPVVVSEGGTRIEIQMVEAAVGWKGRSWGDA